MDTFQRAKAIGIAATVLFHGGLAAVTVNSGLKYIYPPPEEKAITMEFPSDEELNIPIPEVGDAPEAPEKVPEERVEIVKKAEAPLEAVAPNEAPESTVGTDGDVETPEAPRPKEINRRALFSAAANNKKDTTTAQVAATASNALETGHAEGNSPAGPADGQPSLDLYGRSAIGGLPKPGYDIQASGMITVKIKVNAEGYVTEAFIDVEHTNISSASLRKNALEAAKAARFNRVEGDGRDQVGGITYRFILK